MKALRTNRTLKSVNARKAKYVAHFLRKMAKKFCADPSSVSVEDARDLDRALKCCDGISDIDRVWVLWCFKGEPLGWLTDKEIVFIKGNNYQYFHEYPTDPDESEYLAEQEESRKRRELMMGKQ